MRVQSNLKVMLTVVALSASAAAVAQATVAATKGGKSTEAGGGISIMNPDYGHGAMLGGTVWADVFPEWVPRMMRGVGIEAEARDIDYHRSAAEPPNLSEISGGGGLIYQWTHFAKIHPLGKVEAQFGSVDYASFETGRYAHQTRTLMELGAGAEYHAVGNLWVRGEYDYQIWKGFYYTSPSKPAPALKPQGFTVGAVYHFNRFFH